MNLPHWITQEDMYNLDHSTDSRNWMFHDFLVLRFSGKYSKKDILRKLRISRFAYRRLTIRMEEYVRNSELKK